MSLIVSLSTFSYDDYNNWHLYAISLPSGKKNIVRAKYVLIIVTMIISVILGRAVGNINGNFNEIIQYSLEMLFLIFFVMSLLFPFLFKYGAEKGRIACMIGGAFIVFIYYVLTKIVNIGFSENIITMLYTYFPIVLIILSIFVIGISYMASKNEYLKREF